MINIPLFAMIRKDIYLEWRTKEIFSSMCLLGLIMILLIHFAFETASMDPYPYLPGIMWIIYLFTGTLSLNRTASIEKENDGIESMMSCPIRLETIFLGKLLTNLFFLTLTQFLFLPIFSVFFNINLFSNIGPLLLIHVLGSFGFSIVGTFFSTIGLHVKIRDLFLPLLLFPVAMPLFMGCLECTHLIFQGAPMVNSHGFKLVIAYDVIFFAICFMIFEYIIEE